MNWHLETLVWGTQERHKLATVRQPRIDVAVIEFGVTMREPHNDAYRVEGEIQNRVEQRLFRLVDVKLVEILEQIDSERHKLKLQEFDVGVIVTDVSFSFTYPNQMDPW